MRTVASLITELQKFPPDALAYAYEGEVTAVVVVARHADQFTELGYIPAHENNDPFDSDPAITDRCPAIRDQ